MTKNIEIWFNLFFTLVPSVIAWLYYKNLKVSSEKQYLTFWPRLWAGCVDGLVLWPLHAIFTLILQLDIPVWQLITVWFLQVFPHWIYSVSMHGKYGQTIGKMVTRVKVVDAKTHNPISFRHAILRDSIPILGIIALTVYHVYLLATGTVSSDHFIDIESTTEINREFATGFILFGSILLIWYVAELITMLTNEKRRALHDFIASTLVVRTNIEDPKSDDLQ